MKKSLLTASSMLVTLALAGFTAAAQETVESSSQSTTKIEDVKESNKVSDDVDADEVITNKKMRAESGSKSKWSIGTALNYSGSTVKTPFKPVRPNIAAGAGVAAFAQLGGDVGVGYKMTSTDRLSLDVGVKWATPLEGDSPRSRGKKVDKVSAANPSVSYSKMYKWAGIQSVFSAGPGLYTESFLRNDGYLYSFSVGQNNVYDVGTTGLSIGVYTFAGYNGFDKTDELRRNADGTWYHITEDQGDFAFAISPFVEYVINDTFNLRTVFNYASFDHNRAQPNFWKWSKNRDIQSVGLGISVTRDIFLYPNVQFAPKNITNIFNADETNVALNTNINIF